MVTPPSKRQRTEPGPDVGLGASEGASPSGVKLAQDVDERREKIGAMVAWLTAAGATGLDRFTFRDTGPAGLGVFATQGVGGGAAIASIPASLVLTVGAALEGDVGQALEGHDATDDMVLWLDMANGRSDPAHPSHKYLVALPDDTPDAPSWPGADLALLDGTNLGVAARAAKERFAAEYRRVLPLLQARAPGVAERLSLGAAQWARSMYHSRRFPSRVLPPGAVRRPRPAPGAESSGVLLPFFDLLNHRPGTQITWSGHGDRVTFTAGGAGVAAGAEVFNSYGAKSNEELLMVHGFAIWDNPEDVYGLELTFKGPTGPPTTVGPLYIHREASAQHDQFPRDLWGYLDDPLGYTPDAADTAPPAVDGDDVAFLLATLRGRLAPFAATAAADTRDGKAADSPRAYAARYRDGQRQVLEDAVRVLAAMLGGAS